MLPENYVESVYAGFIGMNIGIRLGAPIEPVAWTYERIRDVYGDIRDYVKPYTTFAADDDANGPVFLYGRFMTMQQTGNWSRRMSAELGSIMPAKASACSGGAGRMSARSIVPT